MKPLPPEPAGGLDATGKRVAVVASRFNERIVQGLLDGALACLARHGVRREDAVVARVPGAWELPLALDELARSGRFEALVALGAIVRGETPHFDYLCAEASRGIARVAEVHRLPVGFGLLTCDTVEQAAARAGSGAANKGWEAARAALEMAVLLSRLRAPAGGAKVRPSIA